MLESHKKAVLFSIVVLALVMFLRPCVNFVHETMFIFAVQSFLQKVSEKRSVSVIWMVDVKNYEYIIKCIQRNPDLVKTINLASLDEKSKFVWLYLITQSKNSKSQR